MGKGGRCAVRHPKQLDASQTGIPEQRPRVHSNKGCNVKSPRSDSQDDSSFVDADLFNAIDFDSPSSSFDVSAIIVMTLRTLERVPCAFNTFKAAALEPAWKSRTVDNCASRGSIWPVPPPLWRWTGNASPGPRQRLRRRRLFSQHKLLQNIVCMLNWISLGYPNKPTHRAQAGEPVTDDQSRVLETLHEHVAHFCSQQTFSSDDLGRFGEKFKALNCSSQELPQHPEVDLLELLHEIHRDLDPYTKFEKPHFVTRTDHEQNHSECSHQPATVKMPNTANKPVIASRIKWKHPPSFDPRPYLLDPVVASVFDNPDSLRLPEYLWPSKPKARVHCSRPELIDLMKIWDAKGSLALFPCSEVSETETVGIFAVPKDEHFDRLILNPTVLNSRMTPYSNFTKKLAPGSLLALLHLEPSQAFRFAADDLSDFYYTFKVSARRARRNCIGTKIYPSELHGLSCVRPEHLKGPCYPALATLAMGDSHAVEIAQGSHYALLQMEAGCMLESETLEYRKPIPRGDFFELLSIDDHIGVQRVHLDELVSQPPKRDTLVFEASNAAYKKVGLVSHPGKQKRNETKGILLGADFDGQVGRVSAPRSRILLLCWITAQVCRKGTCTRQLLASIVGCWVHVILFRRPLLALVDALFNEGMHHPQHKVFCLSSQARHELMSLVILGPCAQSDLRVSFCPQIYSFDASPWGAGIVVADSTPQATGEFWRHSEQRGYHTSLLGQASAILKEINETPLMDNETGADHVYRSMQPPRIPESLSEGFLYDCVELFRGSGNWSTGHQKQQFRVHDGFDNSGRRLFFKDLLDKQTFREVLSLALRRVVREFHAGPPCLTFGTLRRPRLRNINKPDGFDPTDPLTADHNTLARRTAMVGAIAILTGVYFSCEQTGSSVMFRLHCFRVLLSLGCVITRMAFCNFGSAFNKLSQWLHNKGWLLSLEGSCACKYKGNHFVIQGTFTKESIDQFAARCVPDPIAVYGRMPNVGEAVASYSAQYPISLMNRMALGSKSASIQGPPPIPFEAKVLSFKRVGENSFPADVPFVSLDESFQPRDWFEDPEWIGELADSLHFRTLFKYHFRVPNHINVNESRVYSSWIKHCAKQHRNSRVVGLLDSRVTIGAASKGRSSSYAITRILKQSIPYILGGNLYPGGLHVYSDHNRADAPSRDMAVEPPSKDLPLWYVDMCSGDFRRFDAVCQSASCPKLAGRWLRFLLLLGGDIERNPGPVRPARGDLDMSTGFHPATADRMHRCLHAFTRWVQEDLDLDFDKVMLRADSCAAALRAYGLHLYRSGYPRYMYVYTVTAIQDQFPHHRPCLGAAWQVDRKWQMAEPGQCRAVVPLPVLKAALCVAFAWGWFRWAAVTMLGFTGMLHPSEFIGLRRRDLMLPRDVFFSIKDLYVHLRHPKTARFARQQHVKISDPDVILFVDKVFGQARLDEELLGAGIGAYRNQWNAIMTRLKVPYKQSLRGLTPGTLRGSGATQFYLATENIPLICWRGRWARSKTLEHYLQEVAAQVMIHSLSDEAKRLIEILDDACFRVFRLICMGEL